MWINAFNMTSFLTQDQTHELHLPDRCLHHWILSLAHLIQLYELLLSMLLLKNKKNTYIPRSHILYLSHGWRHQAFWTENPPSSSLYYTAWYCKWPKLTDDEEGEGSGESRAQFWENANQGKRRVNTERLWANAEVMSVKVRRSRRPEYLKYLFTKLYRL